MTIALWSLFATLLLFIIGVAFGGGKLWQRVDSIDKRLDKGVTCNFHTQMSEDVIRMEERTKMASEQASVIAKACAAAVLEARTQWEKDWDGIQERRKNKQ